MAPPAEKEVAMTRPDEPLKPPPGADLPDLATDQALDRALAAALLAPTLPATFRLDLATAMHREALHDLTAQRAALEADHAQERAALRAGHLRLRRDTLALVVGVAFTAGAVATAALPWLREWSGADAALLMPVLAVGLGLGTGWAVWMARQGRLQDWNPL
jgi:hypothetical protein